MLDYEVLRLVWWALLGILLTGFAIMNGFDMGVASLMPFVSKNDGERRIVINTVGPVWEGNQVWLILGGGASFAAWPPLYAVSFSGYYFAIFLSLFAIILRPVGFKFRSKLPDPRWRKMWDIALFLGGFVPLLVFGVAFGNLFEGADFHFDKDMRIFFTGSFWHLFTPFTLLAGLTSVAMCVMHGGVYLALKTEDPVASRARHWALGAAVLLIVVFSIAGYVLAFHMDGYNLVTEVARNGPSNPLLKTVQSVPGGWMANFREHPLLLAAPVMVYLASLLSITMLYLDRALMAFVASAFAIAGVLSTAGLSLFPFLLPSRTVPGHGLTVWDASSSQSTLLVMSVVAVIFVPLVVSYTAWAYRVLRGKVTSESLEENSVNAY